MKTQKGLFLALVSGLAFSAAACAPGFVEKRPPNLVPTASGGQSSAEAASPELSVAAPAGEGVDPAVGGAASLTGAVPVTEATSAALATMINESVNGSLNLISTVRVDGTVGSLSLMTASVSGSTSLNYLVLQGEDAQKLNQVMAIQPVDVTIQGVQRKVKRGLQIACAQLEKNLCVMVVNSAEGMIKEISSRLRLDETVPAVTETYFGDDLTLFGQNNRLMGEISIQGEVALQLYDSMTVSPQVLANAAGSVKQGQDLRCKKTLSGSATCLINLNYRYGAVYGL